MRFTGGGDGACNAALTVVASAVDTDIKPKRSLLHDLRKDRELLSMLIPGLLVVLIFSYIPYYGITIAFQRYNVAKGIFAGQQWVGLLYFEPFAKFPRERKLEMREADRG